MHIIVLALLFTNALAIWPLPAVYKHGDKVLWIAQKDVKVYYRGPGSRSTVQITSKRSVGNTVVDHALARTWETISKQNFVPWQFHRPLSNFEPARDAGGSITRITLEKNKRDPTSIHRAQDKIDESYTLDVTSSGKVTITANTSIGLSYGLNTFTQLFYKASSGAVYTKLAPVSIQDTPKFWWRGLNLDTARTYKPVSSIIAMIDALAYNKMNRLHWHATDAQSWPLVIPSMPALAAKGVYEATQKYTPADVKKVYEYAASVGVQVALEIDMPGHTSSIALSYPDLVAAYNVQPQWTNYCAEPPCGTLKLNSGAVYDFLQKLLGDLLPRIKPLSGYFHLGGDEVNKNAYLLDPTVKSNDDAVLQPLLQKFMDRNMKQVRSAGFVPLVWEEMLLEWNLTLPKDTIVQTWQSDQAVVDSTSKGYRTLAGNYNYWYLDCGYGQWLDFHPSNAANFWPFADYCSPNHNWRAVYSYDPLTGVDPSNHDLVIGGEVHIWSELTDAVNLDAKVWPQAAAAAEVLWSGAKDATGQNRSLVDASPRLAEMRERMVNRGIKSSVVQMIWCTQHSGQCAYPEA